MPSTTIYRRLIGYSLLAMVFLPGICLAEGARGRTQHGSPAQPGNPSPGAPPQGDRPVLIPVPPTTDPIVVLSKRMKLAVIKMGEIHKDLRDFKTPNNVPRPVQFFGEGLKNTLALKRILQNIRSTPIPPLWNRQKAAAFENKMQILEINAEELKQALAHEDGARALQIEAILSRELPVWFDQFSGPH